MNERFSFPVPHGRLPLDLVELAEERFDGSPIVSVHVPSLNDPCPAVDAMLPARPLVRNRGSSPAPIHDKLRAEIPAKFRLRAVSISPKESFFARTEIDVAREPAPW
jgi:hypothetical protein